MPETRWRMQEPLRNVGERVMAGLRRQEEESGEGERVNEWLMWSIEHDWKDGILAERE